MHPLLQQILTTGKVSDGQQELRLHSEMSPAEGSLIQDAIRFTKAQKTLEVGCAYGVSSLYICEALAEQGPNVEHHIVDGFQHEAWNGIGIRNCQEAGYGSMIRFHEELSELCLPRLMGEGLRIDMAVIDGDHKFDHTLIDFFYVNRMLNVGGVVILDDTCFPSINRLIRYLLSYPAYQLCGIAGLPNELQPFFNDIIQNYAAPPEKRQGVEWKKIPPLFFGTCVALRKVAEDERRWDWYSDF